MLGDGDAEIRTDTLGCVARSKRGSTTSWVWARGTKEDDMMGRLIGRRSWGKVGDLLRTNESRLTGCPRSPPSAHSLLLGISYSEHSVWYAWKLSITDKETDKKNSVWNYESASNRDRYDKWRGEERTEKKNGLSHKPANRIKDRLWHLMEYKVKFYKIEYWFLTEIYRSLQTIMV